MADLDTRSKRASSVGLALAFLLAPVLPDGTIGPGDRQHIAWSYSGILAAGGVQIDGASSIELTVKNQSVLLYSDGSTWWILAVYDGALP
jgi:hypothetical protein